MRLGMLKVCGATAICLLAIITVDGLQGQQTKSPANASNWIRDETSGCSLQDQIKVDKSKIVDINPADRGLAVKLLENESTVPLSRGRFKELVYGREPSDFLPPSDRSHMRPYLVRAVSANTTNRSISVRRCHQDLLVFRGSLGGDGPQKDPVIVFLESRPRSVFVSYMTAK